MMGLILLDPRTVPGGYDFERFRDFFASRLHVVPPLRRRLLEVPFGLGRPYWIEDPDIDLDRHLRRAALPSPGTPEQLAEMAAEMNQGLLSRDRPRRRGQRRRNGQRRRPRTRRGRAQEGARS